MATPLKILWLEDFSGTTNQHSSPFLLPNNQNQISVNNSQIIDGAIAHRLGSTLFLDSKSSSAPIKGMAMFEKNDGTNYIHMINQGNIYSYANGASVWTTQQSSVFNTNSTVEFTNFIGRHYMIGSGATEYLRWNTETGSSTVVSGNIEGKYLAVNGAYMMASGGTTLPQRSYFSNVSSDTFTTTTDYFDSAGVPTGLTSFGDGRPFIIFTSNNYLIADPANNTSIQSDSNGCVNHRTIQNVNGNIIFMDYDGFYSITQNQAYPVDISLALKNSLTGNAIFTQINAANYSVIASGQIENRYYCALGNLKTSVKGQTLNSCIVEYDIDQKTWKVHTFTSNDIGAVFCKYLSSTNGMQLFAGSFSSGTVYQMEVLNTYTDSDINKVAQSVTSVFRTKHYDFVSRYVTPATLKKLNKVHFRYYAAAPITVKYSLDGNLTYTAFPATLPAFTTAEWTNDFLRMATSGECKTIGLEFSCTGNFYIYAVGFDATNKEIIGIKGE